MRGRREVRPTGKNVRSVPGLSFRVGIEQVIGAGIVLVDALLDEPHAEHAGVEVEVLLRRSGDGRDVMQAVDALHELFSWLRLRPRLRASRFINHFDATRRLVCKKQESFR